MKYAAGCFFSSILGALVTTFLVEGGPREAAVAEDAPPDRAATSNRAFGAPPPGTVAPGGIADAGPATPPLPHRNGMSAEESINVSVYDRVNRSVVNVTARNVRAEGFFLLELSSEGSGSGAVLDKDGHILTSFHVVEEADHIAVTLYDGKTYEATIVGADPLGDVAVLKVDAPREKLFPVALGDSSRLRVGMRVFAIGNPFGLERTMTTGIISSLNRSLRVRGNRTIKSIIQIDAAINPGNSGGPLLDSSGRLIGINTAIATKTGQSAGVGFAVPVNLAARVIPQLIQHGRVIRPEIGIQRVYETERGLLIARLKSGGPAEGAGLRGPEVVRRRRGPFVFERIDRSAADLIVGVDGKPIHTADDFLGIIESKQPGDRIVVEVIRDEQRVEVPVVLGGGVDEAE